MLLHGVFTSLVQTEPASPDLPPINRCGSLLRLFVTSSNHTRFPHDRNQAPPGADTLHQKGFQILNERFAPHSNAARPFFLPRLRPLSQVFLYPSFVPAP